MGGTFEEWAGSKKKWKVLGKLPFPLCAISKLFPPSVQGGNKSSPKIGATKIRFSPDES